MTRADAPALGDLEIAVLEDIWEFGPSQAKAVHERVGPSRSITLNTVQSTLERLFRKALLRREKVSHAYRYAAAVSRRELLGRLVEASISRIADPRSDGLMMAFVDLAARADDDQLERIEAMIAEHRAGRGER